VVAVGHRREQREANGEALSPNLRFAHPASRHRHAAAADDYSVGADAQLSRRDKGDRQPPDLAASYQDYECSDDEHLVGQRIQEGA
jgi:hypothetical protein